MSIQRYLVCPEVFVLWTGGLYLIAVGFAKHDKRLVAGIGMSAAALLVYMATLNAFHFVPQYDLAFLLTLGLVWSSIFILILKKVFRIP